MDFVIGIVLYEPDWGSLLPRLQSILNIPIYVYDNSAQQAHPQAFNKIKKQSNLFYQYMGFNQGICEPYQMLVESNIEFNYFITLDQDSLADGRFIQKLIQEFKEYQVSEPLKFHNSSQDSAITVGVFAPFHQVFEGQLPSSERFREVQAMMSSGSILNRSAILAVGGFDERFWLDGFDHDYCLSLRRKGYQIIMANRVILKHPLGEVINKKLLWQLHPREYTQHPIWRMRLIARNRRLLWYKHFYDVKWVLREHWQEVKDILKVILVEDSKLARLKAIGLGIIDYYRGRRGAPQFLKGTREQL